MSATQNEPDLRQRIRFLTWVLIIGLVLSGATAIPLETEMNWAARLFGIDDNTSIKDLSGTKYWIATVQRGLADTNQRYPFMAYGTDWLAFGHFVIALAFVGALRDPVRNKWLFTFGMAACALVVPYALLMGQLRGIPLGWRLIDSCFGVVGFIPCWLCHRAVEELESCTVAVSRS